MMSHLMMAAVNHSPESAYAVTQACHLLLTDDKTDLNALVRFRNVCLELDLASKIAARGGFVYLSAATRLAKLLQIAPQDGPLSTITARLLSSAWEHGFAGRYPHK